MCNYIARKCHCPSTYTRSYQLLGKPHHPCPSNFQNTNLGRKTPWRDRFCLSGLPFGNGYTTTKNVTWPSVSFLEMITDWPYLF